MTSIGGTSKPVVYSSWIVFYIKKKGLNEKKNKQLVTVRNKKKDKVEIALCLWIIWDVTLRKYLHCCKPCEDCGTQHDMYCCNFLKWFWISLILKGLWGWSCFTYLQSCILPSILFCNRSAVSAQHFFITACFKQWSWNT